MIKSIKSKYSSKIILTALVIFILSLSGCGKKAIEQPVAKVPVKVSVVKEGEIDKTISFSGTIKSKHKVGYVSEITGKVSRVYVEEGDRVKRGDILIKLDDEDLRAQLSQARAAYQAARARVAQAQSGYKMASTTTGIQVHIAQKGIAQADEQMSQAMSSYKNAKLDYDRMQKLYQSGAISKQALDSATTQYEIAGSRLESAKVQKSQAGENAKLARANTLQSDVTRSDLSAAMAAESQALANVRYLEAVLAKTEMRATIDGVVTRRNAEPGQILSNRDSPASIEITDNSIVYLESNISESDISGLKEGDFIDVKINSLPDKVFKGKIDTIVSAADPRSRTFRVKIAINNPENILKDGMSGIADAKVAAMKGVVLPRHWLKIIEGEFYVVRINDEGKAINSKIVPGYYNEDYVLVKEGLKVGEEIVSVGQENVDDNALVEVKGQNGYIEEEKKNRDAKEMPEEVKEVGEK